MNMKNEKWKNDHTPLDQMGNSFVDSSYSKAFVRHLFVAKEMLGPMIATIHNLGFYFWLMEEARNHIEKGDFLVWKNLMVSKLQNRL